MVLLAEHGIKKWKLWNEKLKKTHSTRNKNKKQNHGNNVFASLLFCQKIWILNFVFLQKSSKNFWYFSVKLMENLSFFFFSCIWEEDEYKKGIKKKLKRKWSKKEKFFSCLEISHWHIFQLLFFGIYLNNSIFASCLFIFYQHQNHNISYYTISPFISFHFLAET